PTVLEDYGRSSRVKLHNLPDRLTFAEAIKPRVDVVERQTMRQQAVNGQTTASEQPEIAGYIARWHGGADVAALDRALLRHETDCRDRQHRVWRWQSCRHRGAAAACDVVGERQRLNGAGELNCHIDTALRRLADAVRHVRV